MYRHEDVAKKLTEKLDILNGALSAWQKVTFNYKKDGTPFQHLSKCFNNADYGFSSYDDKHDRPRLSVSYESHGWQSSEINCYSYDYGKPHVFYTFKEIQSAIKEKINQLQAEIQYYEDALKIMENDLATIDDIISRLRELMRSKYNTERMSYYYVLNDYLTANIKYLH